MIGIALVLRDLVQRRLGVAYSAGAVIVGALLSAAVVEAEEKLAGGVLGAGGAHDGKESRGKLFLEPVTKVTAQVGHVVEGRDPFLVEPLNDLPRPEFWLPVGFRPPDPVVEG